MFGSRRKVIARGERVYLFRPTRDTAADFIAFAPDGLTSVGGYPGSDAQVTALIPPTIGGTGSSGTSLATISVTPCAAPPNNFGSVTTVTVTYDLVGGKKIFLPNPFSIVSAVLNANVAFPTTVSATQTAFCE